MLGLIAVIAAAWIIDRPWPWGVVFISAYGFVGGMFALVIAAHNRAELGNPVTWDAATIAGAVGMTMIEAAVIYLVVIGIRWIVRRRPAR